MLWESTCVLPAFYSKALAIAETVLDLLPEADPKFRVFLKVESGKQTAFVAIADAALWCATSMEVRFQKVHVVRHQIGDELGYSGGDRAILRVGYGVLLPNGTNPSGGQTRFQ